LQAEEGLDTLGDDGTGKTTREKQAMVAGLGFGVVSALAIALVVSRVGLWGQIRFWVLDPQILVD
jgi:hypothetical protein